MATFDGMTLDLTLGGIEVLAGLSPIYESSKYEIYEGFHIVGDVAIRTGATVNLEKGDHEFVVELNYGHRGSANGVPARVAVGMALTWDNGSGSTGGISVDDPSPGATVESGQSLPPTIFTWNSGTKAIVGDVFHGKDVAWVASDEWVRRPQDAGVTARFTFQADPSREDTSHASVLRSGMYGGAWLKTDGTYLRPDEERFHGADTGSWYHFGKVAANMADTGWWLPVVHPYNKPGAPTNNWPFYPGIQWADAGYLWFCQIFVRGGEKFWTNTAYHFQIKKMAARYVGQVPDLFAGYASSAYVNHWSDPMRHQGRVIGCGTWISIALAKVIEYRPGDAEAAKLLVDLVGRYLSVFDQIWEYSNPVDGLIGTYERIASYGTHPEAGFTVPAGTRIFDIQMYQAGIMWRGFFHLWQGMQDLGFTHLIQFAQVRTMMDFIAVGHGEIKGILQHTHKWKNSHPHAPPTPLPPTWASNPTWPLPKRFTIGGHGWALEYYRSIGNDNGIAPSAKEENDALLYLSGPSEGTTSDQVAVYEAIKAWGLASGPDLDEMIEQWSTKPYQWHLPAQTAPMTASIVDSISVGETTPADSYLSPVGFLHVNSILESVAVAETIPSTTTSNTMVAVVTEAVGVSEPYPDVVKLMSASIAEAVAVDGLPPWSSSSVPQTILAVVTEAVEFGDPDKQDEVTAYAFKPGAVGPVLLGTATSVGSPIEVEL